ncbi:DUF397 domain-containing protein [Actinophytocola glycyrrhizae]|uniref:DUF397 domain-containing protein n=1 Tax=Actinophytocola glycyrrhizae TaxID=2044873 RepID=A0ABV9RUH2_9PSEU
MRAVTLIWRKSSRSGGGSGNGGGGDCVEVAFGPRGPLMRDSKTGEHGRLLHASPAAFAALVTALKR